METVRLYWCIIGIMEKEDAKYYIFGMGSVYLACPRSAFFAALCLGG